jgi:tetratricopeptide (TPR) repeat protein
MALRLARRTAHIYDNLLGRGETAVPYYNKILGLVPDDASALTALERIHRRAGNSAQLVEVYRGMLRLAGDDKNQQKELWNQIADIMEADLEDDEGAFEAYSEMLSIAPTDMAVIKKMSALCERSGRLEDQAVLYLKHASLAENPDDKAQVLLKLGTLRKDRLEDPIGAVEAFSNVLELRARDPGAISGLAGILKEASGPAKPAAARALGAVYKKSGAFEEYIVCLQAQVETSRSSEEKKELLAEIAEVFEQRLGKPEHAFTYACRALQEDVGNAQIRAQVERLATENGAQEELAAFYLDVVDAVTDHELQVHLRRRVAEIYDHDIKDVTRAIAEYNKILDVAPGDAEALQALERLYKKAGSFGALADVYRRLARG